MNEESTKKLLEIPEVQEEISKHLWIESEKAGYDVGYERACRDWIEKFSADWEKLQKKQVAKKSRTKSTLKRKNNKYREAKRYSST